MPTRRPPAPPPQIPGFVYERLLGSGGFSDVFLYEQQLPRRRVAVKVLLLHNQGPHAREQFVAEANLMAQLSTHPSIVTIYHADTAGDGRPYLVMEYCPRPNLSVRYRTERLSVAEVLRIGVRLAGAVETAHRAGILHRDIKPANVLTTDYGWPSLTDFGISVMASTSPGGETVGMSIPWAAPEFFADEAERGVPGDVYSLAATVYTLLAGKSPFEDPRGSNSALELIGRIERQPLGPIGRADVPPSLEQVLARAMAKRPEARHTSAATLGRALQRVEQELHLAQTALDLPDTSWAEGADAGEEDLRTRARAVATLGPGAAAPAAPPSSALGHDADDLRAGVPSGPRRRWPALLASAAVVLGIGAVVVIGALNAPDDVTPTPTVTTTTPPPDDETTGGTVYPPAPQDLAGERTADDVVEFTWTAPEWDDGDLTYVVVGDQGEDLTSDTSLVVEDSPGTVCVDVSSRSDAGAVSIESATACVAGTG